jgi:hypothetical protein
MGVTGSGYNKEEIKRLIYEELPKILKEHPEVKVELWNMLSGVFASREQTEDRFEKILKEIQQQREEANKRFEEHDKRFEKHDRRFEKHDRRFEKHDRRFEELLKEIRRVDRRIDRTIGALGARWGVSTEHAFREAMKSVIEELTGFKVERYVGYDSEGKVFGWPDQVELDLVIRDGMVWIMEIKSSVSKSDAYTFFKKVEFYKEREGKKVSRRIIVSPMIEPSAVKVIEDLGIECFSFPEDIQQ